VTSTPPALDSPVSTDEIAASPRGPFFIVAATLVSFAVVAVFFALFAYGLSGLQEQRSQHQLYARFRGLLDAASTVAPSIGGAITPGTPVALLNSPGARLHNVVVVEGTSGDVMMAGPGHLRSSPLPGQPGESLVLGRSSTAGAPFASITDLRRGDAVTVTTGQGTFQFTVIGQRRAGDPLPNLPTSGSLLTLVTSTGSSLVGGGTVVYVDAALRGTAAGAPKGRPTHVPSSEIQGHNDPAAWPYVFLWAIALVGGVIGMMWLWFRWHLWRTWLVGAPILLGLLWGMSDELMRLLPNIY
jgi:sortase A